MKLAFVSTASTWGGGEQVLLQLARGFAGQAEVLIAAPTDGVLAERVAQQDGVALLPLPGRGRGLRSLGRLRTTLARMQPDAVVLNDPHAITYAGVALLGLPAVRIGVRHTCFPVRNAWKHARLIDHLVCVSEAARERCVEGGVPNERMTVVYNGLAADSPADSQIAAVREELGFGPRDAPLLVAIGSLLPVKGFDTAIHAVAHAAGEGVDLRLAIAGDGPERDALNALAESLGVADRVRLLGFRNDAPALLRAADVMVSASHNEGLPLVLIEALHAGAPLVSTLAGGCAEVLGAQAAGPCDVAQTFAPGDAQALLHAVTQTLHDPVTTQDRVDAGRLRAAQRFSIASMVAGYTDVITRLTRPERRNAA